MQTLQEKQVFRTVAIGLRSTIAISGCILFLCSVLLTLGGCKRPEEIRHLIIDADKSGIVIDKRPSPAPTPPVKSGKPTDRMVVAIHETPLNTWTLKISGPIAEVNRTEPQWLEFFRSVTFNDELLPAWKLPEGWKKAEVKPGPFAPYDRLQISDSLKLSVSRLPAKMNLLDNITRWNGQLSLPPARRVDLRPISGEPEIPFQIYDRKGWLGGGGMMPGMKPPMMEHPGGAMPPNTPVAESPESNEILVEYDAPESWLAGKTSSMVPARFQVGSGDNVASVKVTKMPRKLNLWEPASANWAAEVGLNPKEIDFETKTKEIVVDELTGKMISHISDDEEIEGAIIGIRVPREDDAWFIKLTGPKALVIKSKDAFVEFAKSIRFVEQAPK